MLSEFLALDLETTGIDSNKDEIIEIGLVRFNKNHIEETYSSLIKPSLTSLPNIVTILTNITKEDLEDAPFLEEKRKEIQAFIGNLPLVGHNIAFDNGFLKKNNFRLLEKSFDTFDLTLILEPHLPSYKLAYLSDYFQVEHIKAHRALDDAIATAKIFQKLLNKIEKIDEELLSQLNFLAGKTQPDWFLDDLLPQKEKITSISLPEIKESKKTCKKKAPEKTKEKIEKNALSSFWDENINEDILAVEMNEFGYQKISSLAYEIAKKSRKAVVLSTSQNKENKIISAVQDFENETGETVSFQIRKSRRKYLCLERLSFFLERKTFSRKEANFLAKILLWLPKTQTGSRDEVFLLYEEFLLWNEINSHSAFCNSKNCIHQSKKCFFKEIGDCEDLVICSHDTLLEELEKKKFETVFILNSERLEKSLTIFNSKKIDESPYLPIIKELVTNLPSSHDLKEKQLSFFDEKEIHSFGLLDRLNFALRKNNLIDSEMSSSIKGLQETLPVLLTKFKKLWDLIHKSSVEMLSPGNSNKSYLLLDNVKRNHDVWGKLKREWKTNSVFLEVADEKIKRFSNLIENLLEKLPPADHLCVLTGKYYLGRLLEYLEVFGLFFEDKKIDNWIRWIQWKPDFQNMQIHLAPLGISQLLKTYLAGIEKTILVSPAVSIKNSPKFFFQSLGLPKQTKFFSGIGDEEKSKVIVPNDLIAPNNPEYQNNLAEQIFKISIGEDFRQSTIVFFSSQSQLLTSFERMQKFIQKKERVFAQNLTNTAQQILTELEKSLPAVFFLNISLLPHLKNIPSLGKVILTKIPFHPPNPIDDLRGNQSGNYFEDYVLPTTILEIKNLLSQVGNLFPKVNPPKVYLLDERVRSQSYGKVILERIL